MHLKAFRRTAERFIESHPYRLRSEIHPHAANNVQIVVVSARPVPIRLPILTGEVLYHLRSALDHVAQQLVLAHGGTPDIYTAFPVWEDRFATYKSKNPRPHFEISGGADPGALAIVEAAQPYQRVDDPTLHPLWILNELMNIDKHRALLLATTGYDNVSVRHALMGNVWSSMPIMERCMPLVPGYQVTVVGFQDHVRPDVHMDCHITARVAFANGQPCAGEPVADVLQTLLETVRDDVVPSLAGYL